MTGIKDLLKLFVIAACASAATGCFTGIESTPKITAENVRDNGVKVSEEQSFAALIIPEAPARWMPGKRWLVDDKKIALTFASGSSYSDDIAGKTLAYDGIRISSTVTGTDVVDVILKDSLGNTFYHKTNVSPTDWEQKSFYNIPFTVELSAVEKAHSLLRNHIYYIETPRWYDENDYDVMGQRHIPVKITKVSPGNNLYPLKVAFTQQNRPSEPERYIFLTYGNDVSATRNFDRIFLFTDPRKQYPRITDKTWNLIINSQIAVGMTRDECRLALGAPAGIDRAATPGAHLERWSYENGVYLIFEDGILSKFRL